MIAMRLVVTKAHHVPIFTDSIPTYFDDAVIDLIAVGLQTFPLIVAHMHCVPGFVTGLRTLAPTPDVKRKDGLRVQVRLRR